MELSEVEVKLVTNLCQPEIWMTTLIGDQLQACAKFCLNINGEIIVFYCLSLKLLPTKSRVQGYIAWGCMVSELKPHFCSQPNWLVHRILFE